MAGKVYLVGAGPGDPGLLTRRGEQALREADVVLYDALVSDQILDLAPPHCECVSVGKRAGAHSIRQEEINRLLVERALDGRCVVRLKGGDPFLFGRGTEEALACSRAGVEIEVIPGVSSALAVPALAGIPLTHRGLAGVVVILHGRLRHGSRGDAGETIDWEAACRAADTLVVLMGMSALDEVRAGLLAGGRRSDEPVAVIESGSSPAQRTLVSTVDGFPAEVARAGFASPGIIIVGEVVRLRAEWAPPGGWRDGVH